MLRTCLDLLFICVLLENFKNKYNYTYKWSIERMKEDVIELPVDLDNNIDYETIENLINL